MEDIAEQLAIRDSYRRKAVRADDPQERLNRFYALQAEAAAILMKNLDGFQTFWRRNAQKRAVENVQPEQSEGLVMPPSPPDRP